MTYSLSTIRREPDGALIVGSPRKTDAIGHSLRGAFERSQGIPEELLALLRQLDDAPKRLH